MTSATQMVSGRIRPAPPQPSTYEIASQLLGGKGVLKAVIETDEDAHRLVAHGLPVSAMLKLIDHVTYIGTDAILLVLGVSPRSYARRKASRTAPLSLHESGRLWRFAELLALATRVFGSQEAAERWFEQPAIALSGERPIDMLATPPGARLVSETLTRMEYGVYT